MAFLPINYKPARSLQTDHDLNQTIKQFFTIPITIKKARKAMEKMWYAVESTVQGKFIVFNEQAKKRLGELRQEEAAIKDYFPISAALQTDASTTINLAPLALYSYPCDQINAVLAHKAEIKKAETMVELFPRWQKAKKLLTEDLRDKDLEQIALVPEPVFREVVKNKLLMLNQIERRHVKVNLTHNAHGWPLALLPAIILPFIPLFKQNDYLPAFFLLSLAGGFHYMGRHQDTHQRASYALAYILLLFSLIFSGINAYRSMPDISLVWLIIAITFFAVMYAVCIRLFSSILMPLLSYLLLQFRSKEKRMKFFFPDGNDDENKFPLRYRLDIPTDPKLNKVLNELAMAGFFPDLALTPSIIALPRFGILPSCPSIPDPGYTLIVYTTHYKNDLPFIAVHYQHGKLYTADIIKSSLMVANGIRNIYHSVK